MKADEPDTDILETLRKLVKRVEILEIDNRQLKKENEQLRQENTRLKKRIEELERKNKRYVAPHSRELAKEDPKPSGRRAGEGTFSYKQSPKDEDISAVIAVDFPNICPKCQTLLLLESYKMDKAFITELPKIKPQITQYNVPVVSCPNCGKEVRGEHPDLCLNQQGATRHQLGPRLHAGIQYAQHDLNLSGRKAQDALENLLGIEVTQGAISQAKLRSTALGTPLRSAYEDIRTEIQQSEVVHQDDTGWRINGTQAWLQVASTSRSVFFQVRTHHTAKELLEMLGNNFQGVLVTDRFRTYDASSFKAIKQQKCLYHIVRNAEEAEVLQEGKAGQGKQYAARVAEVCRDALELHREFRAEEISLKSYLQIGRHLSNRMDALLTRTPLVSKDNERLRTGLLKQQERGHLLRFLENPAIPPTNNAAERDLRSGVIGRKVSQCSKTQEGADGYAILKSVIETAKRRGQDPLEQLTVLQIRAKSG